MSCEGIQRESHLPFTLVGVVSRELKLFSVNHFAAVRVSREL